jgi:hypothetical protein
VPFVSKSRFVGAGSGFCAQIDANRAGAAVFGVNKNQRGGKGGKEGENERLASRGERGRTRGKGRKRRRKREIGVARGEGANPRERGAGRCAPRRTGGKQALAGQPGKHGAQGSFLSDLYRFGGGPGRRIPFHPIQRAQCAVKNEKKGRKQESKSNFRGYGDGGR